MERIDVVLICMNVEFTEANWRYLTNFLTIWGQPNRVQYVGDDSEYQERVQEWASIWFNCNYLTPIYTQLRKRRLSSIESPGRGDESPVTPRRKSSLRSPDGSPRKISPRDLKKWVIEAVGYGNHILIFAEKELGVKIYNFINTTKTKTILIS